MPRMQQRRDTSGNWTSANPVLASGEFGLETDTGKFKVGDGTSVWSSLSYVGVVSSVNGLTGNVILDATSVSAVASINSLSGTLTIAGGDNVTVTTAGSTITIAAGGGGGGGGDPVLTSVSITASVNDYTLPTGDIFRIQNTAATGTVNITGLATANGGAAKLLVNVSTHTSCSYTLKHADTNSTAVSRLLVPWEGDYVLSPKGGAALVVYDDTDERWRVV
jgi:hypothetical protein